MRFKHNSLPWILAALIFAFIGHASFGADQMPANKFTITTGPVLQSPTENSMTVTWITSTNATAVVEYGLTNGELKTAFASRDGLIDANERLHKVFLRGLQPGAVYRYRIISQEIDALLPYKVKFGATVTNGFHQFQVFDQRKTNFSFLVFNDIHDQPATIPELLKIAGEQSYDFVLFNGDTVNYLQTENQITAMLDRAVADFASDLPLIWVRGNHETRGQLARQLPNYIASPNGRYFYSFDHGPVHFVVLDTGEDKIDNHREYNGLVDFFPYRREEGDWLKTEIQSEAFRRAKYRVVICHMPFPGRKAAEPGPASEKNAFLGMADAFNNFGSTLDGAGVDLMISGHTHEAAIVPAEPGRHHYPIVIGGGPKGNGRTIIRVNVSNSGLEAVVLRPDGSKFGTCTVPAAK